MDDDLPKEGELLDISRNKKKVDIIGQDTMVDSTPKAPVKIPFTVIAGLLFLAVAAFVANLTTGKVSPEKIAVYRESTQAIFETMRSQFPYLVNISCEEREPNKPDCINFVGTFRPNKDSPSYLASMDTNDKVYGASQTDIALIKEQVKLLVEIKRTTLTSVRDPLTFLIDSVNIPRVGEEGVVRIRCKEDRAEVVECASER